LVVKSDKFRNGRIILQNDYIYIYKLINQSTSLVWFYVVLPPYQNICRCWLFLATLTIRFIQKFIANM
jgi:hypothetical protein